MNLPLPSGEDIILTVLDNANTIAFLTGAGVSTDSGIPDFQTVDDEWTFPVPRDEATSLNFFQRDPQTFWKAFRYLFEMKTEVRPNEFHRAVANLENREKQVIVLTQNVDGLHSAAGTSQVGELHGNILWAYCSRPSCPERQLLTDLQNEPTPRCGRCSKYLRPDTVLFGENPRHFGDAKQVCLEADVLIVAGTALEVGPVNDLPRYREWWAPGKPTVWINRDAPPMGYNFSHVLRGELSHAAAFLNRVSSSESLPKI